MTNASDSDLILAYYRRDLDRQILNALLRIERVLVMIANNTRSEGAKELVAFGTKPEGT